MPFFSRLLGQLHGRVVHRRRVTALAEWFIRMIPDGHRVLDVGCGDGFIDSLIIQSRPDLTIRGIDVMAREKAHIHVDLFDGKTLPFPDQSFDSVIVSDTLHHTESPLAIVAEIARVSRSTVIIKDHLVSGLFARATLRFMDFIGNAPHGVTLPYNYLRRQQWNDCFSTCHLRVDELHTRLGLYPWWGDWMFGRNLHFIAKLSRDVREKP